MVAQWLFNGVQQNWIRGFDVVTLHQLKRRTEGDELKSNVRLPKEMLI